MKYRVIIGGHSQVPTHLPNINEAEVSYCKLGGAKLDDFWIHPTFRSMRESNNDLAIIFLGGNDIHNCSEPNNIVWFCQCCQHSWQKNAQRELPTALHKCK